MSGVAPRPMPSTMTRAPGGSLVIVNATAATGTLAVATTRGRVGRSRNSRGRGELRRGRRGRDAAGVTARRGLAGSRKPAWRASPVGRLRAATPRTSSRRRRRRLRPAPSTTSRARLLDGGASTAVCGCAARRLQGVLELGEGQACGRDRRRRRTRGSRLADTRRRAPHRGCRVRARRGDATGFASRARSAGGQPPPLAGVAQELAEGRDVDAVGQEDCHGTSPARAVGMTAVWHSAENAWSEESSAAGSGLVESADMCRNIRTLFNFDPPATDEEIRAASLQFVRKLSGFTKPSAANQAAFDGAIDEVAGVARRLIDCAGHQRPAARSRGMGGTRAGARGRAVRHAADVIDSCRPTATRARTGCRPDPSSRQTCPTAPAWAD